MLSQWIVCECVYKMWYCEGAGHGEGEGERERARARVSSESKSERERERENCVVKFKMFDFLNFHCAKG